MDRPLEVGDLVVVIRTCCVNTYKESGGAVGTVKEINNYFSFDGKWQCAYCHKIGDGQCITAFNAPYTAAPASWLRRIPPLSELESVKQTEEITA